MISSLDVQLNRNIRAQRGAMFLCSAGRTIAISCRLMSHSCPLNIRLRYPGIPEWLTFSPAETILAFAAPRRGQSIFFTFHPRGMQSSLQQHSFSGHSARPVSKHCGLPSAFWISLISSLLLRVILQSIPKHFAFFLTSEIFIFPFLPFSECRRERRKPSRFRFLPGFHLLPVHALSIP